MTSSILHPHPRRGGAEVYIPIDVHKAFNPDMKHLNVEITYEWGKIIITKLP
jgi:hypothetical protein